MKTIGLLGGMSWESTQSYYQLINQGVKEELGGLHSAKIALLSVDFAPLERMQMSDDWDAISDSLLQSSRNIERAGADFLLICTNTMHKVADAIEANLSIPIIHIADAAADAIKGSGIQKIGLLGTSFTMEQSFYRRRLEMNGVHALIPEANERAEIHRIIYEELCRGEIKSSSKDYYLKVMQSLNQQGAEGMLLACTEIGLLVDSSDISIPLFDTTLIHAQAAVREALSD